MTGSFALFVASASSLTAWVCHKDSEKCKQILYSACIFQNFIINFLFIYFCNVSTRTWGAFCSLEYKILHNWFK